MNKKKLLSLLAALTLVGVVGIGATLAYFTDKADVENVFTMGHVDVTLTENGIKEGVDKDGNPTYVKDETVITEKGLTFDDVMPGQTVSKNPTITVADDSENCYVRAMVTVESEDGISKDNLDLLVASLKADITAEGRNWTYNEKDGYYYYALELTAKDVVVLFEDVTVPGKWGNDVADKKFSIKINADAVQSDYLADDVLVKDGNKVIGWNLTDADIKAYPSVSAGDAQ